MQRPFATPPRSVRLRPRQALAWLAFVSLALTIVACAPATVQPPPTDVPVGGTDRAIVVPAELADPDPLLRTAWEAWLRMELRWLQQGSYSTDALLELALPSGVRWTVIEYGPADYTLAVTGDTSTSTLRVDPSGVHVQR